jgi:hypothetical protein
MKRILAFITVLLLFSTLVLASCENDTTDSQSETDSQAESSITIESNEESKEASKDEFKEESKEESKEVSKEESSEEVVKEVTKLPTKYEEGGISLEAASFSEKPYFALVGRCSEGAIVKGEANGETVTSKSYHGWYSLRLKCTGKNVDVKISQEVDGNQVGETLEYRIKPTTPGSEMWPTVTGGDFQFFFQKMLPDFQGKNVPSAGVLNNLSARVKIHLESLRKVNPDAEIIYMIVPSSMTTYPELVPSQYAQATGETKLDKTMAAIVRGGGTVIDLKSIFAEHKNDEMPLYYKLDSHWSDYGAYVAYNALFEHISEKFPEAAPRPESDFNWNEGYYNSGDMAYYLAMSQSKIKEYSYYRTFKDKVPASVTAFNRYDSATSLTYSDEMTYENTIVTGNDKLPNCIVMRDSYSTQMYDILAERMNRTVYCGMWGYGWNNWLINSEKPDYVIYLIAEWNIDSVLYN